MLHWLWVTNLCMCSKRMKTSSSRVVSTLILLSRAMLSLLDCLSHTLPVATPASRSRTRIATLRAGAGRPAEALPRFLISEVSFEEEFFDEDTGVQLKKHQFPS
eukprot:s6890_g3.t2